MKVPYGAMREYPKYKVHITKVAEVTGLTTPHIYNIIHGRRKIRWEVAETLETLTGIAAPWWMRATKKEVSKKLVDPKTWQWLPQNIERGDA
jgi:plasmid maintenance system antidote protein VapI